MFERNRGDSNSSKSNRLLQFDKTGRGNTKRGGENQKGSGEKNVSRAKGNTSRVALGNFVSMGLNEEKRIGGMSSSSRLKANVGSPLGRSASYQNINELKSADLSRSTGGSKLQKSNGTRYLKKDDNSCKLESPRRDRYLPKLSHNVSYIRESMFGAYDDSTIRSGRMDPDDDPVIAERNQIIREQLLDEEMRNLVLSYENDLPESNEAGTCESVKFQSKTVGGANGIKPSWSRRRFIPKTAERTLDAPDLVDNFYYNVLDWGGSNQISVGLEDGAYLWHATSGNITKLEPPPVATNSIAHLSDGSSKDNISSIKWSGNETSSCLAIGRESGCIQLWDVGSQRCIRKITVHTSRVGALSWNRHILSTGSQSGLIVNLDVRVANCVITRISNQHTQEVCSLMWSPDGRHLASGGNDNLVHVWNMSQVLAGNDPLHTFTDHNAAVKALAWHPRESNLLASGGGTSCGHIYLWNIYNGLRLTSISTDSQVSGIVWSNFYNEFISAHGYPHNRLTIWNYPTMSAVCHLTGHSQRVLAITPNPDGSTVASIGGDETLRLWRCFQIPKSARMQDPLDSRNKVPTLNLIR